MNALGLALLAAVLLALGLSETAAVRACSGLYVGAAGFFIVLSLVRERALVGAGEEMLPRAIRGALWTGAALAHGVQVAVLVGFPLAPSVGLFLLGLWILLVVAGAQFVSRPSASARTRDGATAHGRERPG